MPNKKKELGFYIGTVVSCLVAMTVIVIAALLIYDKLKSSSGDVVDSEEAMASVGMQYDQEEVDLMLEEAALNAGRAASEEVKNQILGQIATDLASGKTMVETIRPLYPDDIVVVSGGTFHFVPINKQLKMHGLNQESVVVLDNGEMQYIQDGQVLSHKGIDVSKYQGKIDWQAVAADGIEFAIIRLGIRGYGEEGNIVLDDMFHTNIKGAQAAGIKVGVYFFAQATSVEEALEEAQFVLEQLEPYTLEYPIVYDVEKVSASNGRMNALNREQRTEVVVTFMEAIKDAGYTPMLYANMEMLTVLTDVAEFEPYHKWYANYGSTLYYPYDFSVWQYSEKGRVNGIQGDVDMNISFTHEWK